MREILFRGKRLGNGEWIFGDLIHDPWAYSIQVDTGSENERIRKRYAIMEETLGQYTGLKDKNGNKIFEGDIIKTRKSGTKIKKLKGYYGYDSEGYPQKIPGYDGISEYMYSCEIDCYAKVEYNPVNGGFYLDGGDKFVGAICNEVVGNIHDNPELLEK